MSKASKKRDCPALGHVITPAECGANRVSRHHCPPSCHYLPFSPANYSQLLELEGKLDRKSMEFVAKSETDKRSLEREIQKRMNHSSMHAMHAWYACKLFFQRDDSGRTGAQRLEQSSSENLTNDELVLLRAKQQIKVALIEIHCIRDHEQIEAVDLLDTGGKTLLFRDRSLAASAGRFSSALTWIYPAPHFWRVSGTGIVMPEFGQFEPQDVVIEIARHLGGPVSDPEMRLWLAENFVRFGESLHAVSQARRVNMYATLDAKYGTAVYELRAPFADCREVLDGTFDVELDRLSDPERGEGFAEARVWFDDGDQNQSAPPNARPMLGRVLMGQAHWRLEAMGAKRFARLRERFETQMGTSVRLTGERVDDFAASMASKAPPYDKSLVPPRLLEMPEQMSISSSTLLNPAQVPKEELEREWRRALDQAFLEDHVPALDGRTPREAARDPALRPKLIRLLKQRVRGADEHNLKTGETYENNWLLRELGADEITFNPPPPRQPPPNLEEDVPEDEFEDALSDEPQVDPLRPPAPRLPDKPLTFGEAVERWNANVKMFGSPHDAEAELLSAGATILRHADEISFNDLNDTEFALASIFIVQAALILITPGRRAPITSRETLERVYLRNVKEINDSILNHSTELTGKCITNCSQPEMMDFLGGEMIPLFNNAPKKVRPRLEAQPVIMALIKSVVEVLDAALRK